MKNTIVIIFSILLVVSGLGCMALSSYLTPAEINERAVKYVVDSEIANTEDYEGYGNLYKANKLTNDVDSAHKTIQFDFRQQMDKDDIDYSMHRGVVQSNEQVAVEREQLLFGETGLLSMGLSMLGVGGLGGVIGLLRRKPGDWSPEEVETTLTETRGKIANELSAKDKQIIQLVQSVSALMKTFNLDKEKVKPVLNSVQDGDVQVAVATVKKELGI